MNQQVQIFYPTMPEPLGPLGKMHELTPPFKELVRGESCGMSSDKEPCGDPITHVAYENPKLANARHYALCDSHAHGLAKAWRIEITPLPTPPAPAPAP